MSEDLQMNQKKSNGAFIAIIIILLLMLAGMAYLWSSKNSELNDCSNTVKTLQTDMKTMNSMMSDYVGDMSNDLKTDFQRMLADYDELKKNGTPEQNEQITQQQEEIQKLLDELTNNKKLNASTIARLRRENDELRSIMRGYVYEIDSLNTLNLTMRNSLDSTNTALNQTQSDLENVTQQADQLQEQVKEGQKLHAYAFETVGLRQKLNNDMTPTTRAKNVVQIRSSFTIGKNALTDAGNKDVYLQVIGPDKKTLQGSSANIISTDKGDVPYSDKKVINYQNQSIDVSVFYSLRGQKLSKGNYQVKIFCQGQLIGSDSFTLK
jgi:TolA-binding protein